MRTKFDEQLEQLNSELIKMGGLCEEVITNAARALLKGDPKLAKEVLPVDQEIDRKEGPAADFFRPEDGDGYGTDRRSGGGYC